MNLNNQIAIVTGVSKGIGLATVKDLVANGVKVAGWGRSKPNFEHEKFYFFQTNVRNKQSVEEAYKQTVEKLGADIRILVNNAGLGIAGALDQIDPADWHTMFETNVHGIFYCTRLVLQNMKDQEEGHIINISSIAGLTGIEEMSGYCATKYAVRGISQSLYKEVRNYGVKVTCIYPGSVNTNFFDNIESVTANENMMRPEDISSTIMHALQSHPNYHHVDIEVRPLMPKGKRKA